MVIVREKLQCGALKFGDSGNDSWGGMTVGVFFICDSDGKKVVIVIWRIWLKR